MMKNITLGQYYPVDSWVHRLDPRIKILLTIAMIVAVFMVKSLVGYALVLAFVYLAARMAKIPFKMLVKGVRALRFILILTFLLNLFFNTGATMLVEWGFVKITLEGLNQAIHYSLRLVFLVMGTSLMTLTTSPIALSDGMELLLSPLKVIRFPAHELAMMMSIALRFIPTLMEEADKIMKAQMARGADFESGNLIARAKAMVPLLVPLFVSAFRRAGDLAMAMESRCYHGGENRTRLRVLKITKNDWIAVGSTLALIALIVLESRLVPDIVTLVQGWLGTSPAEALEELPT
ncbi:MAG: energy-coupling factor transporter transmembrane protein EcfT [Clostridia bacterium]|nr:energy-coupling factor transporter transmembrane protein EcfT [Clostridia bacterium]